MNTVELQFRECVTKTSKQTQRSLCMYIFACTVKNNKKKLFSYMQTLCTLLPFSCVANEL